MCGEKYLRAVKHPRNPGSPPRVRGKAVAFDRLGRIVGITPACAGKSLPAARQRVRGKDHPRVCGEKLHRSHVASSCRGSPPRVRGKGPSLRLPSGGLWITPACAGKSAPHPVQHSGSEDHPRVCGEKLVIHRTAWRPPGSPPRVRGKAVAGGKARRGDGITPACAGKSTIIRPPPQYPPDHPRVCGEKQTPCLERILKPGSPPRVRGKVNFGSPPE